MSMSFDIFLSKRELSSSSTVYLNLTGRRCSSSSGRTSGGVSGSVADEDRFDDDDTSSDATPVR